jgi:hypothetical protein
MRAVALAVSLLVVPASASAATNWGFGVGGQKTATITWAPDDGQDVTSVVFTLPVKVKKASSRRGQRCTVSSRHPKQVRCPIKPATAYGYIDVVALVRIPCRSAFGFAAKPVGGARFVRQGSIASGNGCS